MADGSVSHLEADRERVRFVGHGAVVDVWQVADLLGEGVDGTKLGALEQAAALLRGEFLDGLDLPLCYRFHHWCMAERERIGNLRRQVLAALVEGLRHDPERALPYAHARVAADPLAETAHAALVRLLAEVGRAKDADAHYTYARDLLQRELAAPLTGELRRPTIGRDAGRRHVGRPVSLEPVRTGRALPSDAPVPFVGHEAERRRIDKAIRSLAGASTRPMLMFLGEPGIGKTRLLQMVTESGAAAGAGVISARCFEAEMVRPYGMWIDALRGTRSDLIAESSRRDLAVLLPISDPTTSGEGSRSRLFAAVAELIGKLARERPLVIAFDDLQWIDEGSASLLHFLARSIRTSPLLLAGAARHDEVDDNPWAKRLIQSLERDRCLDKLFLGPLGLEETAVLIGRGVSGNDVTVVQRETGGNPLFILELARARQRGSDTSGRTLEGLIEERIERLDDAARETVVYAAVIGSAFQPEILAAALDIPEVQVAERLERLERRGLLRPNSAGQFDFAHDLVRHSIYRKLSQARRRMIHRRIAAALSAASQRDGSLHGDLVHHAGLAEDYVLAARACVAAGDRCLRMFANLEAEAVAERGLAYLERISPGPERTHLQIALLNVKVWAGFHILAVTDPANARMAQLLRRAADEAEIMGLAEEAASAHQLISWLAYRSNDHDTARAAALDVERRSRTADGATKCEHLARTGRCLLDVEAEIDRARRFMEEAAHLAADQNLHIVEVNWGLGLIARWDGDLVRARDLTRRAVALARTREERWRELECLLWLAKINLELQSYDHVIADCDEVLRLATLIGAAHAPVAKALRFLGELHQSGHGAAPEVDTILIELRDFDDKANLAYFLNECAAFEFEHGRTDCAQAYAREALATAVAVRQTTEVAVASAILARIAHGLGDNDEIARHVAGLTSLGSPQHLSARARSQLELALASSARTFQRSFKRRPVSS